MQLWEHLPVWCQKYTKFRVFDKFFETYSTCHICIYFQTQNEFIAQKVLNIYILKLKMLTMKEQTVLIRSSVLIWRSWCSSRWYMKMLLRLEGRCHFSWLNSCFDVSVSGIHSINLWRCFCHHYPQLVNGMVSQWEVVLGQFSPAVPCTASLLVVVQRYILMKEDLSVFQQIRPLLGAEIPWPSVGLIQELQLDEWFLFCRWQLGDLLSRRLLALPAERSLRVPSMNSSRWSAKSCSWRPLGTFCAIWPAAENGESHLYIVDEISFGTTMVRSGRQQTL